MDERFVAIQKKLSELKNDRTKYFTQASVLELYIELKDALSSLTADQTASLRPLINDILLIFSLAFITSGHTREPISIYAKLTAMRSLYPFIYVDLAITPKELDLLEVSLQHSVSGLKEVGDVEIPDVPYLDRQNLESLDEIYDYHHKTAEIMAELPENEYPLNSQITHLRRSILAEIVSPDFKKERLQTLSDKFDRIMTHIKHSDHPISEQLKFQCHKTTLLIYYFANGVSVSDLKAEDADLLPIFEKLGEMLPELDVLIMTRRWTLRATDLYQHMNYLLKISPSLHIGMNVNAGDSLQVSTLLMNEASKYYYLVTYMARKAWVQLFKLLDTIEPVSEALSSLYNQLLTLKRCLNEVQLAGGISNLRELYPFQMKLSSLDDSRTDGKFLVNGEVPPGQGVLNGMLADCYEIVYELKVELEEKGEDTQDDSNAIADEEFEEPAEDMPCLDDDAIDELEGKLAFSEQSLDA